MRSVSPPQVRAGRQVAGDVAFFVVRSSWHEDASVASPPDEVRVVAICGGWEDAAGLALAEAAAHELCAWDAEASIWWACDNGVLHQWAVTSTAPERALH